MGHVASGVAMASTFCKMFVCVIASAVSLLLIYSTFWINFL